MKFDFLEARYRIVLIALFYMLSILMILAFFYMDNSRELKSALSKIDKHNTADGFGAYALIGLIQYGLLIAGISMFCTLTYVILKRKL